MDVQFNWLAFLKNHGIPFIDHGSNVAPNHVNIKCPFCVDDPSQHMGLSLNEKHPYYACWRNTFHRGKNPTKVVAALLKVNYASAEQLIKTSTQLFADDLMSEVEKLSQPPQMIARQSTIIEEIKFPSSIRPLGYGLYTTHFYTFLRSRKFPNAERIAERFDLCYSIAGKWAWRLIFPVRLMGKLVSFIGRDITNKSKLRYKNLPNKDSAIPLRECLLFEDDLQDGGQALYITEGPFDALKLAAYLPSDQKVTCCFGIPTYRQLTKLSRIAPKFKKIVLALDADMALQMVALVEELSISNVVVSHPKLPPNLKDPGDMTPAQVINFARHGLTRSLNRFSSHSYAAA